MHALFGSWSRRASILARTDDDTNWEAIRDEFQDLKKSDEKVETSLRKA
jgi:hypothetical protein